MATACNRFRAAVLEGDLTHDGSAVLACHVGQHRCERHALRQIITKDANSSPRKIDAAVAAVDAFERAEWWAANNSSDIPLAVFV